MFSLLEKYEALPCCFYDNGRVLRKICKQASVCSIFSYVQTSQFLVIFIIVLLERLHDLKKRKKIFRHARISAYCNDKIVNLMVYGTVLAISRAYL